MKQQLPLLPVSSTTGRANKQELLCGLKSVCAKHVRTLVFAYNPMQCLHSSHSQNNVALFSYDRAFLE